MMWHNTGIIIMKLPFIITTMNTIFITINHYHHYRITNRLVDLQVGCGVGYVVTSNEKLEVTSSENYDNHNHYITLSK